MDLGFRNIDYHFKSSFADDFSIADKGGESAIRDTFERSFNDFKADYIMLTELCIILNWKLWEYHEKNNEDMVILYDELWGKANDYAIENLKGKELDHFYSLTD